MSYYSNSFYYMTPTVKKIIIINVAVFISANLLDLFNIISFSTLSLYFGLVPRLILQNIWIWQFITYMFLHHDLWHLIMNMLMLWFFGPAIESSWGKKEFLRYYFWTGIGAGLCSFLTALGSFIPIIGASGAIFGLLVAYAMLFPESVVLIFFLFPMKIKHAVILFAAINLWSAITAAGSGIAYFAHLGGALFGYIYLKSEWLKLNISKLNFHNLRAWMQKKSQQKEAKDKINLDEEVDHILEKINKQGIKSLTRRERKILEWKSKPR